MAAQSVLVIDPQKILSLRELQAPDEPDVVQRVIGMFLEDSAGRLARAGEALQRSDWILLRREAHSLRGSAGILGADVVREAAGRLEAAAVAGESGAAETLLRDLADAIGDVQTELRAFESGLQPSSEPRSPRNAG
jgi:histidine phosphotransfer protein HptB